MINNYEAEVRETAISNLAENVVTYYKTLLENGIHQEFAEALTVEFQACFLEIIQANNEQNRDRN